MYGAAVDETGMSQQENGEWQELSMRGPTGVLRTDLVPKRMWLRGHRTPPTSGTPLTNPLSSLWTRVSSETTAPNTYSSRVNLNDLNGQLGTEAEAALGAINVGVLYEQAQIRTTNAIINPQGYAAYNTPVKLKNVYDSIVTGGALIANPATNAPLPFAVPTVTTSVETVAAPSVNSLDVSSTPAPPTKWADYTQNRDDSLDTSAIRMDISSTTTPFALNVGPTSVLYTHEPQKGEVPVTPVVEVGGSHGRIVIESAGVQIRQQADAVGSLMAYIRYNTYQGSSSGGAPSENEWVKAKLATFLEELDNATTQEPRDRNEAETRQHAEWMQRTAPYHQALFIRTLEQYFMAHPDEHAPAGGQVNQLLANWRAYMKTHPELMAPGTIVPDLADIIRYRDPYTGSGIVGRHVKYIHNHHVHPAHRGLYALNRIIPEREKPQTLTAPRPFTLGCGWCNSPHNLRMFSHDQSLTCERCKQTKGMTRSRLTEPRNGKFIPIENSNIDSHKAHVRLIAAHQNFGLARRFAPLLEDYIESKLPFDAKKIESRYGAGYVMNKATNLPEEDDHMVHLLYKYEHTPHLLNMYHKANLNGLMTNYLQARETRSGGGGIKAENINLKAYKSFPSLRAEIQARPGVLLRILTHE